MSDQGVDSVRPAPAPGFYPVPDHHQKQVVEREWEGEIWTSEVRPAAEGATLPKYKRHLFGFLKNPGWKLLIGYVVFAVLASALWEVDKDRHWVSGIQILLPLCAGLATLMVMVAFLIFIGRRVRFDRIEEATRSSIVKWGLLSGVVGVAFALGVEIGVPKLFGDSIKGDQGWSALAGPAEETGKLLVPVILWLKGYFRRPIEGYMLVLVSACTFGVIEGTEYGAQPHEFQVSRPVFEIMHPLFTGFIAAVAWPAAWRAGKIFTGALLGSWLIAVFAHSLNDVVVLDKELGDVTKLLSGITLFAVIVMYLLQKHAARQLVPPDNVADVSPRWRPAAPKVQT